MHIGFLSTRLAGTDGVSLETAKLALIIERLGHQVFYCAGELDSDGPEGMLSPEMHFEDPQAKRIHDEAFGAAPPDDLRQRAEAMAKRLYGEIGRFVETYAIELLVPQNALAIPMQIPLGMALTDYIQDTAMPTVAHNHDLFWERPRFARCALQDVLDRCFPPVGDSICHLVINRLAQASMKRRKGVEALLLPNIFDYANPPPAPDAFVADLRAELGLADDDRVVLQPTRVVPRKNIEVSIDLVARLGDERNKLVITHHAGDEGLDYLHTLQRQAEAAGVDLRYVADRFAPSRNVAEDGRKTYSLWDAYPLADLVTYPSEIEGFGNAFLEAVYFKRPIFVNRYPVYVSDLAAAGFKCVEMDGVLTDDVARDVADLLQAPSRVNQWGERNYQVALERFSYEAVTPTLEEALARATDGSS